VPKATANNQCTAITKLDHAAGLVGSALGAARDLLDRANHPVSIAA
jgi:hypothetical protein